MHVESVLSFLLSAVYSSVAVPLYFALFAHLYFGYPLRRRRVAAAMGVYFAITLFIVIFIGQDSVLYYVITAAKVLGVGLIAFGPPTSARFWVCLILSVFSEFILELLGTMVFSWLFPDAVFLGEFAGHFSRIARPNTLPVLFMLTSFAFALPLAVRWFLLRRRQRMFARRGRRGYMLMLGLSSLLTLGLLILSTYVATHNSIYSMRIQTDNTPLRYYFYVLPVMPMILFVWQAVQLFHLYLTNSALEDRIDAYRNTLTATREFRHNIMNTIYGFEGVLMSGDMDSIQRYYADMARRCRLANNENADALNRIGDAALTTLLLRKLDLAAARAIPLYLSADPGFVFDGLPPAQLADVLGNLLDNALEAAERADDPRVDVLLRSTPDYCEILICNTYPEGADLGFLTGEATSSKPDHTATGLASVRKILHRHPAVCFNQYVRGRYVESSLCRYNT